MNKNITIIIPARSSNFFIDDFLKNILLWSIFPNEIIIINTSNKKYNLDNFLLKKIKKRKINLKIINKRNLYPGAARNIGILNSKSDYIAFLDMNTLPYNNNWLEVNYDYLKKKNLDGVTGKTIYLANNNVEKIIRASTYGKAALKTIPGSIFKKKVVLKVGKFNSSSRAGEDTDWLKRLNFHNFKIENSQNPLFYKGLYNTNFITIVKKWFRNYYLSSELPHLNSQKNFYYLCIFILFFLFVFNWNYSSLCLYSTLCANDKNDVYIPHITKIFLAVSFLLYSIFRGIIIPIKKKIQIKYLFPYRFIFITLFSFILDLVKSITFLTLIFLKFFYLPRKR